MSQIRRGIFLSGYCWYLIRNKLLGAKGPPLVGEEVRNKEVGKVGR